MHKGLLRIVGCVIGGALGLISTIWLIPRFETLGMYLFIVFCLHGLAAWIAFGSERISYMGLQIALTFDLGVLKDYGPAKGIDPIRDRFIGIILGILIIATVFSLVWPEDARSAVRQKLVACLRAVTRLLNIRGGRELNLQRERLELEIASRLAEANAFQEQAAFEALIHGPAASKGLDLENVVAAVEEVYVASLPWIREQAATAPAADRETASRAPEMVKPIVDAVEASAALIESSSGRNIAQGELPVDERERVSQSDAGRSSERFEELVGAVKELHVAVSGPLGARS
jgi:multidrug resistance protein MdtO